jgi:membrane peptidoglycan carboxypeptidase
MGSTFKIFTMVAALEHGYTLDYPIIAKSPYQSKYIVSPRDLSVCGDKTHWCPKNADPSMNGPRNMWTGFGMSVNTYFVPLEERVGAQNAVAVAKKLGIQFRAKGTKEFPADYEYANDKDLTPSWGPFTLGVSDAVPLELANAYATLAADGKYCEPIPVTKITDHEGHTLNDVVKPRCTQAIKPEVARAAVDAARCPVYDQSAVGKCRGGTAPGVHDVVNRPIFGKTGTSDANWTATMALSTRQLAIAATMADPDNAEPNHQMVSRDVNMAVAYTMRDALKGQKKLGFPAPSSKYTTGKQVSIPPVTCRTIDEARSMLRSKGFQVEVDTNHPIDSPCPEGRVARSDPSGSTVEDGYVMLYVSNGKAPKPTGGPTNPPGPGGPGGGGNGR